MPRVAGRIAVVTGAAGGLGRQFCTDLAAEGATVVGVDIADQAATRDAVLGAGATYHAVTCDLTDEAAVRTAMAGVTEQLGAPTILVNNAGIFPSIPFAETTVADWRRIHRLNVEATFVMTQCLLDGMLAARWGRIVMITSAVVFLGPPRMTAYTASKAALVGLTRSLASELGDTGITVNAIAPGLTRTETALTSGVKDDFERVVAAQAIPYAEEARDLSSTLLYVCDEGSSFLTGQTVNVDGGFAKH